MADDKKPVSRLFTQVEAKHTYKMFEKVHCYLKDENGEPIVDENKHCVEQCPGWDWNLEHIDNSGEPVPGGCRYKKSSRLCEALKLAAEGHYVLEIRPKTEDDAERERKAELRALEEVRRKLAAEKAQLEERIIAIDNKMRNL